MPAVKELSRVLIVSPKQSGEKIAAMLDRAQFDPPRIAENAGEARRLLSRDSFDIIIINSPLSDEQGFELALDLVEQSYSGVMLIVKSEIYDQTRYRVEDQGVLTVQKPLTASNFQVSLDLVNATARRLAAAEEENQKLRRKLEETRIVSRAKVILITRRGMSESDAHRFIEKGAMDSRLTRREFAERIIDGE